jgi:phosphatidylglycerophosphate synthase
VLRHVVLRWRALPNVIERWSICNAVAALIGAGVSLALHDVRPAVGVAVVSLVWVYVIAAPSGVSLANAITALRTGLLCAALVFVPERGAWIAAATVANFTLDGVDGWVARKLGQMSDFGGRFDMESDSHTVLLLDLLLVVHMGLPLWVLGAGILRYAFVLCRFGAGPRVLRERRSSFSRWVFSLVIVSRAFACLPDVRMFALPLLALATLAVCVSFAPDFYALRPTR